jgi:uncharacterized protein
MNVKRYLFLNFSLMKKRKVFFILDNFKICEEKLKTTAERKYNPIDFTNVDFTDNFWKPRIDQVINIAMPQTYIQLQETGRIDAFKLQWKNGMPNQPHIFWDSDVAKWLESAALVLRTNPDSELEKKMNDLVDLIISAQHDDGYLNTHFTVVNPDKRWTHLRDHHELYCAGHLMEAAVAHFETTGKKNFLDAMCRYADYIDSVFGVEENKKRGYPGHQEIELALIKLYHATHKEKYLKLAKYFIDERGNIPDYFMMEAKNRGEEFKGFGENLNILKNMAGLPHSSPVHCQNHIHVREQDEIFGHAVRAMYMYSGMVDVALETQDSELLEACYTLWEDTCLRKMYITGGVGSSRRNEGITYEYHLPNAEAYAETCAAIALVFWNHRMLQINCDGKFGDIIEKALYNGIMSSYSLSGDAFFYENPLAVLPERRGFTRDKWFGCSCCPNNLTRVVASLGQYMYSTSQDEIAIHLYAQSSATLTLPGKTIEIIQKTNYPWDGNIKITINPILLDSKEEEIGKLKEKRNNFDIKIRIPGWCNKYTNSIEKSSNGALETSSTEPHKGYLTFSRVWEKGDTIILNFDMPVEKMKAHPKVKDNLGKIAIQRGPIIYCFEEVDNGRDLENFIISKESTFEIQEQPDLLPGTIQIVAQGIQEQSTGWKNILYGPKTDALPIKKVKLIAIPYCFWSNRLPGEMTVWIKEN